MGIAIGNTNAESSVTPVNYLVVGSNKSVTDGSYQNTLSGLAGQNVQAQLWDRIVEGGVLSKSSDKFSSVILLVEGTEIGQTSMFTLLKEIEEVMIPGAQLEVRLAEESWIEDKLKEIGLVDIMKAQTLVARKADPTLSQPLRIKRQINKDNKDKKARLWKLQASEPTTPDIDESGLLTTDDHSRRVPIQCDVKRTRKPCKNCTCGLSEMPDLLDADADAPKVGPTSSCGNCGLGDAFRCSDCPYVGLPAFKPGQKIELGSFLANDV